MKILLTGSTGMVGRNVLELTENGQDEFICPTSSELNLLDRDQVRAFYREHKPDLVIHAAGVVGGIQANIKNPVKFLVDNTLMGVNVIGCAQEEGVKYLLNLASSCMYPRNAENPLKEDYILTGELEPTNEGYALAKITSTKLCEYIARTDKTCFYRTVIPCNLYGKYDKFDPNHSHMIPAVVRKIHEAKQARKASVEIWGDGLARREFMYAADLADFIFYAIDKLEDMPQTLNVGLGFDYSINEYYQAIADAIGFKGEFVHDTSKPVGMQQKLIDDSKLKDFGWVYKTDLDAGICQTYHYFLNEVIND